MTAQRAIEIIGRYDVNFCRDDGEPFPAEELTDAFEAALDALRRTRPAEPERAGDWRTIPVFNCGACGRLLSCTRGYRPRYCAGCGKRVRWDG